jgi:hypothetical protein
MQNVQDWDQGWYRKWIYFVIAALSCLNKKSLNWDYLPSHGGYYDQDYMIMEIWETVRHEYRKCLKDKSFMEIFKEK